MSIDHQARIVWDYMKMNHPLEKADCIIVLGSHDTRVAKRGAEIFLQGWAPYILFSGYLGALTLGKWDRPEADIFADIAIN
ncbi:MAG: YdcF family protein, partial [Clostridia bacterium]|nr:YdcF family protein [Clostridia bacterium]